MPGSTVPTPTTLDLEQTLQQAIGLHQQGRLREAEELYQAILRVMPDLFDGVHLLGVIRYQQGRFEEAVSRISAALEQKPDSAEALANLGLALQALSRHDEALSAYDRVLAITPDHAEALHNRGNALRAVNRLEDSIASYEKALTIKPDYALAFYNRGVAFQELNRHEEAIASYENALAIEPDDAEVLSNRGTALNALNRHAEALASYDQALVIKPDDAELLSNRGATLRAMNRHSEALASFEKALAVQPDHADAHWNESLVRLSMGDFVVGWQKFEWRLRVESFESSRRTFSQPAWRGKESVEGKTLLLHAEQGLGDTLQFARYVSLVARIGAEIILATQPPLKTILASLDGADQVLSLDEPLPGFDFHCPLMSLPLAFETTLESMPAEIPYLAASQERIVHWKERLGEAQGMRIGLVWSGSPKHRYDPFRSIALETLLSLLKLPGFQFVSLQKEVRGEDRTVLEGRTGIVHFGEELGDFSDTAALVSLMDLVISVDTAVAHLAGALGKPLWILLPFSADWRWMLHREDSPWYPTARLFRQPRIGDWYYVVHRVADELAICAET